MKVTPELVKALIESMEELYKKDRETVKCKHLPDDFGPGLERKLKPIPMCENHRCSVANIKWITPEGVPIYAASGYKLPMSSSGLTVSKVEKCDPGDHHRMVHRTFINLFNNWKDRKIVVGDNISKNDIKEHFFNSNISNDYFEYKWPEHRIPIIPKEFYKTGKKQWNTFMSGYGYETGMVRLSIKQKNIDYNESLFNDSTKRKSEIIAASGWNIQAWKPLTNSQRNLILGYIRSYNIDVDKILYIDDESEEQCVKRQLGLGSIVSKFHSFGHAYRILELTNKRKK